MMEQHNNDGKVGVAYTRNQFANTVNVYKNKLLETQIENLNVLNYKGIEIDNSTFNLDFSEPKTLVVTELDLDTQRATLFTSLEATI